MKQRLVQSVFSRAIALHFCNCNWNFTDASQESAAERIAIAADGSGALKSKRLALRNQQSEPMHTSRHAHAAEAQVFSHGSMDRARDAYQAAFLLASKFVNGPGNPGESSLLEMAPGLFRTLIFLTFRRSSSPIAQTRLAGRKCGGAIFRPARESRNLAKAKAPRSRVIFLHNASKTGLNRSCDFLHISMCKIKIVY